MERLNLQMRQPNCDLPNEGAAGVASMLREQRDVPLRHQGQHETDRVTQSEHRDSPRYSTKRSLLDAFDEVYDDTLAAAKKSRWASRMPTRPVLVFPLSKRITGFKGSSSKKRSHTELDESCKVSKRSRKEPKSDAQRFVDDVNSADESIVAAIRMFHADFMGETSDSSEPDQEFDSDCDNVFGTMNQVARIETEYGVSPQASLEPIPIGLVNLLQQDAQLAANVESPLPRESNVSQRSREERKSDAQRFVKDTDSADESIVAAIRMFQANGETSDSSESSESDQELDSDSDRMETAANVLPQASLEPIPIGLVNLLQQDAQLAANVESPLPRESNVPERSREERKSDTQRFIKDTDSADESIVAAIRMFQSTGETSESSESDQEFDSDSDRMETAANVLPQASLEPIPIGVVNLLQQDDEPAANVESRLPREPSSLTTEPIDLPTQEQGVSDDTNTAFGFLPSTANLELQATSEARIPNVASLSDSVSSTGGAFDFSSRQQRAPSNMEHVPVVPPFLPSMYHGPVPIIPNLSGTGLGAGIPVGLNESNRENVDPRIVGRMILQQQHALAAAAAAAKFAEAHPPLHPCLTGLWNCEPMVPWVLHPARYNPAVFPPYQLIARPVERFPAETDTVPLSVVALHPNLLGP